MCSLGSNVPSLPPSLPPSQSHLLGDLTEVPLPVRFIYLLLGPADGMLDYHEIGRAMATLMSDKVSSRNLRTNPDVVPLAPSRELLAVAFACRMKLDSRVRSMKLGSKVFAEKLGSL